MEASKTKVTKEVLCEESRFILANVMAEARYGRQNRYDDIRRVCEGAVSIPFTEYVGFLEAAGYLKHDRGGETLEVTESGEKIVNGGNLTELTNQAVSHFKNAKRRRSGSVASALSPRPSRTSSPPPPPPPSATGLSSPPPLSASPLASVTGSSTRIAAAPPAIGADVFDARYEKLELIGTGGVGQVYKARQVPLDREVAVKEIRELFGFFAEDLHPEIRRRFGEVVRAAAHLAHPNILPIHDVNLDRSAPYVVCELAMNGSCRRLITEAESIPVSLTIKYLLQTLHALRAAHKQDVAHRGLKPENMLIDAYGNLKVSDFGMTRIVERDQSVIRQVYVGMDSVAYMAPELFNDPEGAGVQTDIYALGIIFYELLTRKLPGRRSPMPSDIDSNIPRGIDDIFDLMTRDDRAERYASVDDILDDFDKIPSINDLVGSQTAALEANNPLAEIKFKGEGSTAESGEDGDDAPGSSTRKSVPVISPMVSGKSLPDVGTGSGAVLSSAAAETKVIESSDEAEDNEEASDDTSVDDDQEEGDGKSERRPYSYQQRNKK